MFLSSDGSPHVTQGKKSTPNKLGLVNTGSTLLSKAVPPCFGPRLSELVGPEPTGPFDLTADRANLHGKPRPWRLRTGKPLVVLAAPEQIVWSGGFGPPRCEDGGCPFGFQTQTRGTSKNRHPRQVRQWSFGYDQDFTAGYAPQEIVLGSIGRGSVWGTYLCFDPLKR